MIVRHSCLHSSSRGAISKSPDRNRQACRHAGEITSHDLIGWTMPFRYRQPPSPASSKDPGNEPMCRSSINYKALAAFNDEKCVDRHTGGCRRPFRFCSKGTCRSRASMGRAPGRYSGQGIAMINYMRRWASRLDATFRASPTWTIAPWRQNLPQTGIRFFYLNN